MKAGIFIGGFMAGAMAMVMAVVLGAWMEQREREPWECA